MDELIFVIMVYSTMLGIVTDNDNASAHQVRYQDDCEQWTEKNLEAGKYTFFDSTVVKFVWGTKKKTCKKPCYSFLTYYSS